MISVGSPRKSGRSKRLLGRRRNQTSNSNDHFINPLLCLEGREVPKLRGLVATLVSESEGRVLGEDDRMNADMMEEEIDGER